MFIQFLCDSASTACDWTTPGVQLITDFFPNWGVRKHLDFLTVNRRRYGYDLDWASLSTWWCTTRRDWSATKWPNTWQDNQQDE